VAGFFGFYLKPENDFQKGDQENPIKNEEDKRLVLKKQTSSV